MPDDDALCSELHLSEAIQVFCTSLESRRRTGVTPVPRNRTEGLIVEWSDQIAARRVVPSTSQ